MNLYESLEARQVRKSAAQKKEFASLVGGLAQERGLPFRVETSGSLIPCRNLVIGDPDRAKVIFAAHYDTCAAMPFPNLLTPRNPVAFLGWQLLLCIPLVGIPLALMLILRVRFGVERLPSLAVYFLLLMTNFLLLMAGPANRHTMNDNTSGVAAVLRAVEMASPDAQAAYVLFDNEELGMLGSAAFAKAHPSVKSYVPLINLDCVGDGEYMLLFPRPKARRDGAMDRLVDLLEGAPFTTVPIRRGFAVYPSDQTKFDLGVGVAAFHRTRFFGYWMGRIHTKRDTVLNVDNVEFLARAIAQMAKE